MKPIIFQDQASLVEGCKKGDRKAQEVLYQQFGRRMFGVCLRYAHDYATAEDILQDGFIKVYNGISGFRGEGSLEGWIRRIIVNTAIEQYRKSVRLHVLMEYEERYADPIEENALSDLKLEDLLNLIQELPDGFRTVFNLHVIEGYTHKEIAEKLEISEGTSKSQLARARKLLQKKILKEYKVNIPDYATATSY